MTHTTFWTAVIGPLLLVASLSLAATCAPGPTTAVALPSRQDSVFIVDTSGSMATPMPSGSLMEQVRRELVRFTTAAAFKDNSVRLVTFDEGIQSDSRFNFPNDRAAFVARVNNLQATGKHTYVYRSLGQVLSELRGQPDVANAVYLFTDGEDNERPQHPIAEVINDYGVHRGAFDWLFYVNLGLPTPTDVRQATNGLSRVRAISTAEGAVPQLSALTVRPSQIVLGNFQTTPGAQGANLSVDLTGAAASVPVTFPSGDALDAHGAALTIHPSVITLATRTLQFNLLNATNLPPGQYHTTLCLNAPDGVIVRPETIPITFDYHPAPAYAIAATPGQGKSLQLNSKGSQTLDYALTGNTWAKDPVTVDVKNVPDGLQIGVNGRPAPGQVLPGQPLRVTLTNVALPSGQDGIQPALAFTPPPGASINTTSLMLPSFSTPKSFWQQWWWLILILALLAALLLALLAWYVVSNRAWAKAMIVSPGDCRGYDASLRGSRPDVGQVSGCKDLDGLRLERQTGSPNGVKVRGVPSGVELRSSYGNALIEVDDHIEFEETVVVVDATSGANGSLTLSRA